MSEETDAFLERVEELADLYGVELHPDDVRALYSASMERGGSAESTEEAFDELFGDSDPDEYDYEDDNVTPENHDGEIDPQLAQDLQYGVARTEERLGRKLTNAELEQVGDRVRHELATGGGPREVAAAFESSSAKSLNAMSKDEHRNWARERCKELHAQRNPQPEVVEYDDSFEGMRTYARARANGYEADEAEGGE